MASEKNTSKIIKNINKGFSLMEMIVVIAIISILLGLASVGISGYFEMSDQMRRTEVAESAFYSLQSYVSYLKRQGEIGFHLPAVSGYCRCK